ncbi:hypothetical protein HMPREF1531_02451 [Propionibacterium sp. oral taxon 192 str. F0372]|uniref:hypothetical protein n=1 Tax=Propionibacterium sp. oral taxon 192 TaxID=671222 RepID=UPI000352A423|nr:hypothetical protein [Propionibacterium sp. oral taxon 192]EPH00343.1 hypothetical protein HMPREF1531_02451 [Propionibacterium sp. oral taxon 192 str. F0372]
MAGRRHGHRTSENIVAGNFRAGMDGIEVRRSTGRRRSVSARIEQGRIVVFVPAGLNVREERDWVERMVRKLARKNTRASAPDLLERAGQLAAIHLDGATGTQLRPTSSDFGALGNQYESQMGLMLHRHRGDQAVASTAVDAIVGGRPRPTA